MLLNAIRVSNFRSLRETPWINLADLTALIGQNDGGKTACTDAIELLLNRTSRPDEADFSWELDADLEENSRAQQIVVEAVFQAEEKGQEQAKEILGDCSEPIHIKRTFNLDGTSTLYRVGMVPAYEEFRTNWKTLTIPNLKELAGKYSIDLRDVTVKADIVAKMQEWIYNEPPVEGEVELSFNLFELLPQVQKFTSAHALDPEQVVNNALKLLCKQEIESDMYRGELEAIQQGITESLRKKLQELTPFIKKYYSEVDEARIDPIFNIQSGLLPVPLKLSRAGGGPIELQKKGEGKRRQVALGIYEWTNEHLKDSTEQNVILILDEPDTHMDYHSQRKLFDIIQGYVESNIQLIICTHSLNLINRMPVEKIRHFRLDSSGQTTIECLSTEEDEVETRFIDEIGLSLGLDTGTIFHERCFFVVEGPTEIHLIPEIFRLLFDESLQSAGIRLVNGEGTPGARHFARFLKNNGRKVVFLLDSDCRTNSGSRTFSASRLSEDGFIVGKDVFFIGDVEFEDAFDDAVLVTLANRFHPKEEGALWRREEFSELRGDGTKLSRHLQRLFRCAKPQIGHELSQVIQVPEHVPGPILSSLARAYDLAN